MVYFVICLFKVDIVTSATRNKKNMTVDKSKQEKPKNQNRLFKAKNSRVSFLARRHQLAPSL